MAQVFWKTIHKDKQNGGIFGCSVHLAYLWYILPFLSKPPASLINLQCAGVVFLSLLAEFWLHRRSFQLSIPESQREEIKRYVKAAWIGKFIGESYDAKLWEPAFHNSSNVQFISFNLNFTQQKAKQFTCRLIQDTASLVYNCRVNRFSLAAAERNWWPTC